MTDTTMYDQHYVNALKYEIEYWKKMYYQMQDDAKDLRRKLESYDKR